MLRKLGLHIITLDIVKNIELLKIFFDNINKTNIVKVTEICLYEIINLFQKISKLVPDKLYRKVCRKPIFIYDEVIEWFLSGANVKKR